MEDIKHLRVDKYDYDATTLFLYVWKTVEHFDFSDARIKLIEKNDFYN